MNTITTNQLINIRIKIGKRTKLCRVIKNQIFAIQNGIKHHLIGNIYYDELTNDIVNIAKELSISKIKHRIK
jgi:gentisate 1,2-dioxygenase